MQKYQPIFTSKHTKREPLPNGDTNISWQKEKWSVLYQFRKITQSIPLHSSVVSHTYHILS